MGKKPGLFLAWRWGRNAYKLHENGKKFTVFENYRKVSFNIASEASYVYILSGQKLSKNA